MSMPTDLLEKKRKDLVEQQSILAKFGLEALRREDMEDVLQLASELVAKGLESGFAKILKFIPEEDNFLIVAGVGWSKGVVGRVKIEAGRDSAPGFAFHSDEPVVTEDLSEEKRFRVPSLLRENRVRSAVNVIIRAGDERWGVLEADSKEIAAFSREDVDFLYGFSNILGIALSRLRYAEELKRTHVELASKNSELEAKLTELKEAADALRERESQLQTFLDSAPAGIIVADAAGSFIFRNKLADEIVGGGVTGTAYGPEGGYTIHRPDGVPFPPEELPLPRVLRGKASQEVELVLRQESGEEKTILVFARPIVAAAGQLSGAVASMLDISERKQAEQRLKIFADLMDQSNDGILVIDLATGRFSMVNDKICRDLQYRREELLAMRPEDISSKGAEFFGPYFRELRDIGSLLTEDYHRRKDGSTFPVEVNIKYTEVNHREFAVAAVRDISERRRLEQELQKGQKLESIGLLAGGIAHDFNNILTAILGNIELAKMFLARKEKAFQRLEIAERAALEARGITQQLLTFARGGAPIKNIAAVPQLVRDSVEFALRGANVNGEFFFPLDLWLVEVDETQIRQVINNLTLNAYQAMPEGGTLSVSARNERVGPDNPFKLREGKYVRIDLTDQGIGIPAEHLGSIFDPYFTTKNGGSGLGLPISYSIAKRHGGTITVSSTPGEGTTFSLFLPASEEKEIDSTTLAPRESFADRGRILIMDDDENVNAIAADLLQHLGYRVETVKDGAEAVNAYGTALKSGDPFEVVITDLTVPGGMGGKETIRHLQKLDPRVKVIVSSGYANDPIMSDYANYGFRGVVPKPYNLAELGKTVREVLDRG